MDRELRFRSLYEHCQPDVFAYFVRRLDRDDAIDATADVFLVAWRRIDEVPADVEARLWLFGVAHNVLANRRRSARRLHRLRARLSTVVRGEPPPSPETVVLRSAEDRAVLAALERLRAPDRDVLTLRLWEETTFADIAQIVGCSQHATEQRYARALRRFRSVWGGAGHELVEGTNRSLHGQEHSRDA